MKVLQYAYLFLNSKSAAFAFVSKANAFVLTSNISIGTKPSFTEFTPSNTLIKHLK